MLKLIAGLRHFRDHLAWERQELFERSVGGQRPHALLVTCSDSRVLPETLMQADPGDLFVARNAGNLIPPPETPSSEAATIEYAVTSLGVTDLIVCGHYRCGAIRALLDSDAGANDTAVAAWLDHAADTLVQVRTHFPDAEGQDLWDRAVEQNVLVQLGHLARHPAVAAGLSAGTLRLHAWVLRFETSEVVAFDPIRNDFAPLLDMPVVHPTLPAPAANEGNAAPAGVPREPAPIQASGGPPTGQDVAASLVAFLVALPFCLAVARACGLSAEAGILTGIVAGLLVGFLTGSPLQVSGPAAGLIVLLLDVVRDQGVAWLGVVVLLAGAIQIAAGVFQVGRWFRAVSPAVLLGMLAGIGTVVFAQQFHVALDDTPAREPVANLLGIPAAVLNVFVGHDGHDEHVPAALIGLVTLVVLLAWRPLAPQKLRVVPAVLVAVLLATGAAALFGLPVNRVAFDSLAAGVTWLDLASAPGLLGNGLVWQTALAVALIASAETLLCASALDSLHRGPRTQYDRELSAQGVGNAVCGILDVLPMAGGIVRSSTNIQAGARTRWSAILHGLWLLAFALLLPGLLRQIPTSALAAILVLTGVKLVELPAIRLLWKESRSEGLICIGTAAAVVAIDLLTGVLLGVGLSVLKLVHTFSRLRIRRRGDPATGTMTLVLEGAATFLRLPKLAAALDAVPPGVTLHIDLKGLSYIDHACLKLLTTWKQQHEAGGLLVLDWDTLEARFHRARPRPRPAGGAGHRSTAGR